MEVQDGVYPSGTFTFTIKSDELSRGLRPSKSAPRNSRFLVESSGAVGYEKVLRVIDDINNLRIDTSVITDGFPYPQVFVLTNHILICGLTSIYEYDGSMNLAISGLTPGQLWSVVDLYDYIYMSNRQVSISRNPLTGDWDTASLPIATAMCNFNGQVLIGGPSR